MPRHESMIHGSRLLAELRAAIALREGKTLVLHLPPQKMKPILHLLAPLTLLLAMTVAACTAPPASVAPRPATLAPHFQAQGQALDKAQTAATAIPPQADAAQQAAPIVAPMMDAIRGHLLVVQAGVADAKIESAAVARGVDERDGLITDLRKKLEVETAARLKSDAALADRARNRIEWILIGSGFGLWVWAAILIYQLVAGGALTAAEALAAPMSVIRRGGAAVAMLVAGAACFAAVVYFDQILYIGLIAIGVIVLVALVATVLHFWKHGGIHADRADGIQAEFDAFKAAVGKAA